MGRRRQRGPNAGTEAAAGSHKDVRNEMHEKVRISNVRLNRLIATCTAW